MGGLGQEALTRLLLLRHLFRQGQEEEEEEEKASRLLLSLPRVVIGCTSRT